jgi:hypothetical protein
MTKKLSHVLVADNRLGNLYSSAFSDDVKIKYYLEKLSDKLIEAHSCFFLHRWTKWERTEIELKDVGYTITGQRRYCLNCGIEKARRLVS